MMWVVSGILGFVAIFAGAFVAIFAFSTHGGSDEVNRRLDALEEAMRRVEARLDQFPHSGPGPRGSPHIRE